MVAEESETFNSGYVLNEVTPVEVFPNTKMVKVYFLPADKLANALDSEPPPAVPVDKIH